MIEYDNPNFNANLSALVQGMWYSELPELIDLDRIYNNFESVLRSMESGKYPYYPLWIWRSRPLGTGNSGFLSVPGWYFKCTKYTIIA